jgi:HK97 family phage portal protein
MIIRNLVRPQNQQVMTMPELVEALNLGGGTASGQSVTVERAKNLHTAYRCINILSDDVAKMPLQTFVSRSAGQIDRLRPSSLLANIAWLLEISPNRWMTPFVFKKAVVMWALNYGAGYVWKPRRQPGRRPELFILRSDITRPVFDPEGNLWYEVRWPGAKTEYLPDVEVLALLINSADGITGKSVISHARETMGRQLGAHETQAKFFAQGLNPAGILWSSGELSKDARIKARDAVEESIGMGSSNAYKLAIIDNKFTKFEQITMKPVDAQFLESIDSNDVQIANFYGVPLYKLNQGKQSYNSNEQQNLDYLNTTLDPYLVQWEQAAALRWLTEEEQNFTYFRFNRDVLLRTDAKTRGETLDAAITSGRLSPNEARQIEDRPAYDGGDAHYIQGGMARIGEDGNLIMGGKNGEA